MGTSFEISLAFHFLGGGQLFSICKKKTEWQLTRINCYYIDLFTEWSIV